MSADVARVAAALPTYEIGGELGRGGWGVVLRATHKHLDRDVAVKQLPPIFATDPEVRSRFVAEARLLASLDHPHLVPVYDFVEHDGLCLLVMELLPGGSVWTRSRKQPFTPTESVATALAILAALDYAHAHGVLHRDIKPENVMFSAGEVLKVTDFGIAKVLGRAALVATRAGEVLGTPAYMAPEQALGEELTPATDVYATGVLLYELLTGQLPVSEVGDSPLAVVYRKINEPAIELLDVAPHLPPVLGPEVMKALATEAPDRHQSAEAFGVALAEAAAEAFGSGWLSDVAVRVIAPPRIVAAAERARQDGAGGGGSSATAAAASAGPAAIGGYGSESLGRLRDVLREAGAASSERLEVEIEKLQAGSHDLVELGLLRRIRTGEVKLRAADAGEAERLLGGHGLDAASRLGLADGTPPELVRTAALEAVERWQRKAENPLTSRDVADAARSLVRTCEGIVSSLP